MADFICSLIHERMMPEIILGVASLVSISLGALSYLRNPRSVTNRLLGVICFTIALLGVVNYLSIYPVPETLALFWIRIDMAVAVILSGLFFLLLHTFPRSTLQLSRLWQLIFSAIIIATFAITLTPLVFSRLVITSVGLRQPIPGPGILFFGSVAFGVIPLGLYFQIRRMRAVKGIERVQISYLLLGVGLTFSMIVLLMFYFVVVLQDSSYVLYLPLYLLPFLIATTYAIVRYRLLDIHVVIFRYLVFASLNGLFFLSYGFFLYLLLDYLEQFHLTSLSRTLFTVIAVIIAIPIFRYVNLLLQALTDKFLFQGQINYHKALVKIGQNLSTTIQIDEVMEIVLGAVTNVLRSSKVVILLRDDDSREFVPRGKYNAQNFNLIIPDANPLIEHFRHVPVPIIYDEMIMLKEQMQSLEHRAEMEEIENSLLWLDVSVVAPLFVNRELTGILLLGDKLSGRPYLQDDVEFLNALSPQVATALENAYLYKQSLEFGQRLRHDVEAATHELEMANQQLKDLDKTKSEFLSIASHQLYTPLTALRGYVSMLMEGDFGPIPDKQQPILDILNQSCNRLIDLIKNLLDISRIESGRLELNLKSIDLGNIADGLVRDLLPNALIKGLKMTYEPPVQPLPHVVADEQQLRQVMLNFIDNAIKYTTNGWVKVAIAQEGSEIVYSVMDSGKGLSQMDISRLFTKFTRVGGASRFNTEGTGLGLYVARQIVKEHRGEVIADSLGQNQGSVFMMKLPIEGTPKSLQLGDKTSVVIKAAEATGTKSG